MKLDSAVAIVSGATGGIGSATALALAEQGARIVITGRRAGRLAELGEAIGDRGGLVTIVEGDVAAPATAAAVVASAMAQYGCVDLLVNCAGYGPPMPVVDLPESVWDATIDSCLKGSYLMTRAVLPAMLAADAGRIVQVSSLAGKAVEANRTAYCAAQWGLQGFTLALQAELAATNVQVNVINPANVATDWWTTTNDPQPRPVLARMMVADDIAETIVWMLTRPDHVRIGELIVDNARNPWAAAEPGGTRTNIDPERHQTV